MTNDKKAKQGMFERQALGDKGDDEHERGEGREENPRRFAEKGEARKGTGEGEPDLTPDPSPF